MKNGVISKALVGAVSSLTAVPVALGIYGGVMLANSGENHSEFVGYSGEQGLTAEELYNATNTFNYKGNPYEYSSNYEPEEYKYRKYDSYYTITENSNQRNGNIVSTGSPQMTVLTHGLNGGAFHWSNNGSSEFAYSDDSLITRLSTAYGDAQVYWAKMQSLDTFKLFDLSNPNNLDDLVYTYDNEAVTVSKLTSNSSHIIVVFEAYQDVKAGYNNQVYEELNYVISKLAYDIKCLNDGALPKLNLIGHSRGGITNLQYALDHPDLVDSMFGLGTPYLGSTTADTDIGKQIQNSKGRKDIVDKNIYRSYYNRWKKNKSLYQGIKAYSLGGYSTTEYLINTLKESDNQEIKGNVSNLQLSLLNAALNNLWNFVTLGIVEWLAPNHTELINTILYDVDNLKENPIGRLQLIDQGSDVRVYDNDLLVDLRSQLGVKYGLDYNFILYAKCFNKQDGGLSSPSMPAVVHNLEAQDPDFINYILRNIDLGNASGPLYRITGGNKACIIGYRGAFNEERFEFPREINGYPVTKIETEAFATALGKNVKEIVIPSSVEEIGKNAFAYCNFEQITFEKGSRLKKIEEGAFNNCTNLKKFNSLTDGVFAIPNQVEQIDRNAFFGTKASAVELPRSIGYLEKEAFSGLRGLTEFTVESGNAMYMTERGNLYNRDGWLMQYCTCKTDATFTMPVEVSGVEITSVAKSAFADTVSLETVNLTNVRTVDENAFRACKNLQTVTGEEVRYAEPNAFFDTAWYRNFDGEFFGIGKTLLKYCGTSSTVTVDGFLSIGAGAFAGNKSVEEIITGKELTYIGAMAFYGCENLKAVKLMRTGEVMGLGDFILSDWQNTALYVPYALYDEYQANGVWANYAEKIVAHAATVSFKSNGGSSCETIQISYNEPIEALPVPTRVGYRFTDWYDNAGFYGEPVRVADIWNTMEDSATLYAKWTAVEYYVDYRCTGGGFEGETDRYYTCEAGYTFANPVRAGYTFEGWYYDEAYTQIAGIRIPIGTIGDKTVYAKWSENEYSVLFDLNDDSQSPALLEGGNNTVLFDSDDFSFHVPERSGYRFNGWETPDGKTVTDETGNAVCKWSIAENTVLKASWTREKYFIKINTDGHITWLGANGFNDSQDESGIEYGSELGDYQRLKETFNAGKKSLRKGHKFDHFALHKDGEEEFTFWNGIVGDLGEDGAVIEIFACFVREINFTVILLGMDTDTGVVEGAFQDEITFPDAKPKKGYKFKYWVVADRTSNANFANSADLAIGSVFDYKKMPDLSFDREEDGTSIRLEAVYEAEQYHVSLFGKHTVPVVYDSYAQFDIPEEKTGYRFVGWYYTDSAGKREKITDENGNLLQPWHIDSDVQLKPEYSLVVYKIHYEPAGIVADRTYTIETPTFQLPTASKEGHRFISWYTDSSYTQSIDRIVRGTWGDKTLHAYFKEEFSVKFLNGDSIVQTSKLVLDEPIQMPSVTKEHYIGVWNDGTSDYAFGSAYTLKTKKDVTFHANWRGETYSITYHNAYDAHNNLSATIYAPQTYDYGKGVSFAGCTAQFPSSYNSQADYEFVGFYQDSGFINRYVNISETDSGNKDVYIKWRRIISHYYRSGLTTVTDKLDVKKKEDIASMPYDSIAIGFDKDTLYNDMVNKGIRYLIIDITMQMWEEDDGYQFIFICKGNTGDFINLTGTEKEPQGYKFETDGDYDEKSPKTLTLHFVLNIDELKGVDSLYIRYGASGFGNDTWCNKYMHINTQVVHCESDAKAVLNNTIIY